MLIRALRGAAMVTVAAIFMTGLCQAVASAGNGSPPGGGFGGAQCGQGDTPGCTLTAGAPGSSGTGDPGTGGTGNGTRAVGGRPGADPGCTGTVSKAFGCVPAGCTITVQTLACPIGAAAAAKAGPAQLTLPAPVVLAQLAVRYLRLPGPVIRSSPAPEAFQLTELPTWLWVAPAAWHPQSRTVQVPGESVTVTATPVSAAWSMGDGATVTCKGPGTPYSGGNPAASSPTCGHTYDRSSAGQPAGTYQVTVTVTWNITWTGTGGAGGALAPLDTVAAAGFRVAESQALDTGSGG